MRDVSVIGAGMVKFGKYIDTSMKVLGRDAVNNALASAGLDMKQSWPKSTAQGPNTGLLWKTPFT